MVRGDIDANRTKSEREVGEFGVEKPGNFLHCINLIGFCIWSHVVLEPRFFVVYFRTLWALGLAKLGVRARVGTVVGKWNDSIFEGVAAY